MRKILPRTAAIKCEDVQWLPLVALPETPASCRRRTAARPLRHPGPPPGPVSIEDEYAIIYRNVKDAIFNVAVEGPGAFRFQSVNRAFCESTGIPHDAVVGKRVEEVIPPATLPLVLEKYQQAIDNRRAVEWEAHARFPSRDKVSAVCVTPVFADNGVCTNLIGTVHDITELKHTEASLRERNASLLRAIAEQQKLGAALQASEERLQHKSAGGSGVSVGGGLLQRRVSGDLILGLFVLGCGVVIRLSRTPIRLPRWLGRTPVWMPVAVIVLALDLIVASAGFNPAADPRG